MTHFFVRRAFTYLCIYIERGERAEREEMEEGGGGGREIGG
jgi:hypothetical protein